MTITPTLFRALIAAFALSMTLPVLLALLGVDGARDVPAACLEALQPEDGALFLPMLLSLPLMAAMLVSMIGLFAFRHWARPLALVSTLASLPVYLMLWPELVDGVLSMFESLADLLWGAVLALAYASPLDARFSAAKRTPPA